MQHTIKAQIQVNRYVLQSPRIPTQEHDHFTELVQAVIKLETTRGLEGGLGVLGGGRKECKVKDS